MGNGDNSLRRFGEFSVDLGKKVLWHDETPVELPYKAVELLCLLIEREGEVVTKEELLDRIWEDSFVEESVLPQNVYILRKTFRELGGGDLIQTVPRRGYRFAGDVEMVEEVLIERETYERKIIAEAELPEAEDVSPGDGRPLPAADGPLPRARRLSLYSAAGLALLLAGGLFGVFWILPNYQKQQKPAMLAADTAPDLTYERITDSARAFYAGLSPDDQTVAYVVHTDDDKYSIVLHHLATRSETVILKPQELHPVSLQFSPDGNYIYYSAREKTKQFNIYRIPVFGGASRIVRKGITHHFSVSPDGVWLAFYRGDPANKSSHIVICRSDDGGNERIVATRRHPRTYSVWGVSPSWSPDGRKMVLTAVTPAGGDGGAPNRFHLVEVDVATGEEKEIKSPRWHSVGQAYWIDGGKKLMVQAREKKGEPVQIWELSYPDGAARRVTNDTNDYREYRVASDGGFLIGVTWTKSDNLYLFPADDPDDLRQLTYGTSVQNGVHGLEWTPDGKSLLFVRTNGFGTGNLYKMDVETREVRQLTFDKNSFPNYIDPTPDGRSVVFASNRTGKWHIWQVDLDGDNLTQLTDGVGEVAPELSPDGKWLYYVTPGDRPNTLWKRPLAGGEPQLILKGVGGVTRVSPADPDRIASYYFDSGEKKKFPHRIVLFSEKEPGKLIDLGMPPNHRFEWKPDGSGIYYNHGGESFNNLWFVSVPDGTKTQFTFFRDMRISNMDISPDGRTFAVSRGASIGKIFRIKGFGADSAPTEN